MKRSHIIGLLLIAGLVGALVVTIYDASEYATFEMASRQQPETVTVVGTLDLDEPITFNPKTSKLRFTAIDKDGNRSIVIHNKPKEPGFERSEEITLTGKWADSVFIAEEILYKCPSKYTNSEGPVSTASL